MKALSMASRTTVRLREQKWFACAGALRVRNYDMLGICSWTAPWELSPLREKGYIGDIEMESKVFSAVTGI